ncbi:MAG: putative toxin-antitoxin system toxin component, PIN family [Candidatus Hodarchaeales archaeon]
MKKVVLDTCVWVNGLLGVDIQSVQIIEAILNNEITVVISSYIAAEVLSVLRRLARELKVTATVLERDVWAIWLLSSVIKDFSSNVSRSLLHEIKEQTEIQLLSEVLVLEPKDVPLIILAYKHEVPLITVDERSLWNHRTKIEELTSVKVILSDNWMDR